MPSDKTREGLVSSDFGTGNSIGGRSLTRLTCLDCKRETQAGYFRTGNYFNSGESSPRGID
jgi:hypothetical protein